MLYQLSYTPVRSPLLNGSAPFVKGPAHDYAARTPMSRDASARASSTGSGRPK